MKTSLAIFFLFASVASVGCTSSASESDSESGSDPTNEQEQQDSKCEQALDKVQQCGLAYDELEGAFAECKSTSQCIADCMLEANCGEIQDADHFQENALTACMRACE